MEKYNVGKSTCRIALARLVQEGFVQSIPRQGYIITPITLKDVEELFALRLILEPAAAKLAAGKADVRALSEIEAVIRKTDSRARDKEKRIGIFWDANREFHLSIAAASGNTRLVQNIATLLDEMRRLVALGYGQQGASPAIADDHIDLVNALRAGDGKLAEQISYRHVEKFKEMTLARVMESIRLNNESRPLLTAWDGR
jgi:DNA-binding GntR family transcriptional regulator